MYSRYVDFLKLSISERYSGYPTHLLLELDIQIYVSWRTRLWKGGEMFANLFYSAVTKHSLKSHVQKM